jgi:hypothetical protein
MKYILLVTASLLSYHIGTSQVQITSADLPDAGDVLIQVNNTLNAEIDLEATGANYNWDFNDFLTPLGNTNTDCIDISSTPLTYQLFFNNPFDPEHDSDYAIGQDQVDLGMVTAEDAYIYFQNRSDRFAQTGLAATLNGIPIGAQANPVDVIYELPIEFGDQSTSFSALELEVPTLGAYFGEQTRTNSVDGYGTLSIYGETFDVIRVRSEITAVDSVYIEFVGSGFNIERPLTVEYKWLSPLHKVPVLQITTQAGIVSGVQTIDLLASVQENELSKWTVFPNPANDVIQFAGNFKPNTTLKVMDSLGRTVLENAPLLNKQLDCSAWQAGVYFVTLTNGNSSSTQKIIIQ